MKTIETKELNGTEGLPEWLRRAAWELVDSGCVRSEIPLDKKALFEKLLTLFAKHYRQTDQSVPPRI